LPAMVAASERIGGERMIESAILHLKDLGNSAELKKHQRQTVF
jgi:hypothetical protein